MTILESDVVRGWRFERVIYLDSSSPYRVYDDDGCRFAECEQWRRGDSVAEVGDHVSPDDRCECGLRLCTDLAELNRYVWEFLVPHLGMSLAPVMSSRTNHPSWWVVTEVESVGRVLPGWDGDDGSGFHNDPPTTWRCEGIRLMSRRVLPFSFMDVTACDLLEADGWGVAFDGVLSRPADYQVFGEVRRRAMAKLLDRARVSVDAKVATGEPLGRGDRRMLGVLAEVGESSGGAK